MVEKAKVRLGVRPAQVVRVVEVSLPDGSPAAVEVKYRYRTRSEFGALLDQRIADARAADAAAAQARAESAGADGASAADPYSEAAHQQRVRDAMAQHILDIAQGWNLDVPFGPDAVAQLCDELPGAAQAIIDTYRAAIIEGRRGN